MNFRRLCLLLAVASLSACELGEGSRPVSLTIIPAGVVNAAGQLQMTECFREPLALQVTFSDGQIGNVTSRATWSVRDPSNPANPNPAVQVSNGDVKAQAIINGEFKVLESTNFGRGVLIPKAPTTTPVIVTANFLGLKADLPVVVDALVPTEVKAELVTRPVVGGTPPSPKFIGEGFSERFTIRLTKNGRLLDAGDFSRTDSIFNSFLNPVRWTFMGNTAADFVPANLDDDDASNNLAVFVPAGTNAMDGSDADNNNNNERRAAAIATLTPNGGLVTGVNADAAPLTVLAELSPVVGAAPCGEVKGTTKIAALELNNELTLMHENEFNTPGAAPGNAVDIVAGTGELLKVVANLDDTLETQDVTGQVDYEVVLEDRDVCSTTTTTPNVITCTSSILIVGAAQNFLTTLATATGSFCSSQTSPTATCQVFGGSGDSALNNSNPEFDADPDIDTVRVQACYPRCLNNDQDTVAGPITYSNTLSIRVVPATLTSVEIKPTVSEATSQAAFFEVPGVQFKAYGTFTATGTAANNQFLGPASTSTQNIGRYLSWIAEETVGGVTEFSEVAQFVNGNTAGNIKETGQVFYICNPLPSNSPRTLKVTAVTNNTAVIPSSITIADSSLMVTHNTDVDDRACE